MGYSSILIVDNGEDQAVVSQVAGCVDMLDPLCSKFDLSDPQVHFTLETWMYGIRRQQSLPSSIQPSLLEVHSYFVDDGYYMWASTINKVPSKPHHIDIDDYIPYNVLHRNDVHRFFDSWETVYDLLTPANIMRCSDFFSPEAPSVFAFGNSGLESLANYERATGDRAFRCGVNDTVWFSPACRSNTSACVPLVVMYYFDAAIQRATLLNLPLAVIMSNVWVTGDYGPYLTAIQTARFLFHWYEPDDTVLGPDGEFPVLFRLPRLDLAGQIQGDLRTGIDGLLARNFGWRLLKEARHPPPPRATCRRAPRDPRASRRRRACQPGGGRNSGRMRVRRPAELPSPPTPPIPTPSRPSQVDPFVYCVPPSPHFGPIFSPFLRFLSLPRPPQVDPFVYFLAASITFNNGDMQALMQQAPPPQKPCLAPLHPSPFSVFALLARPRPPTPTPAHRLYPLPLRCHAAHPPA